MAENTYTAGPKVPTPVEVALVLDIDANKVEVQVDGASRDVTVVTPTKLSAMVKAKLDALMVGYRPTAAPLEVP